MRAALALPFAASVALAAASPLSVTSSSSLYACEIHFFEVDGGSAPYRVAVEDAKLGRTLVRWPDVRAAGLLNWDVTLPPATEVRFDVVDANGERMTSAPLTVQGGLSDSCLGGLLGADDYVLATPAPEVQDVKLFAKRGQTVTVTQQKTATVCSTCQQQTMMTVPQYTYQTMQTQATYATQQPNVVTDTITSCPTTTQQQSTVYVTTCPTCPAQMTYQTPTTSSSAYVPPPTYSTMTYMTASMVSQSPVYTTYLAGGADAVRAAGVPVALAAGLAALSMAWRLL